MSRLLTVLAALVALSLSAQTADANGRFPTSTGVGFTPGETQTILVPVTFGLLVSTDGGTNFDWVCEQAIGYTGTYDPAYTVAADGAIFATNYEGVRVSRDGACQWDAVTDLEGKWVSDIEVGGDGKVWAVTFTGGQTNDVWVSSDNGLNFVSANLPRDDVWFQSVKIAPSDPDRIYVTGLQFTKTAHTILGFVSENGGATWQQMATSTMEYHAQPRLLLEAVAPDDPDTLFASSVRANTPLGDILYRSVDKGQTWTEIARVADTIAAVLSRAGGSLIVGSLIDGVRVSANNGTTFTSPTEQPPMNCIGVRSDGLLFACGLNWAPSFFAIATSSDGQTWTPMMRFCDIRGPLQCDAGTIQAETCTQEPWDVVQVQVAVGDCDAPPGVDAGVNLTDGAPTDGPTQDAGTTKPPDKCGGCGSNGSAVATLLVLLPLFFRRRKLKNVASS